MSTYTSNYGWTKPSGSDNVDISVLNNNLDNQDRTIHDAFLNMAPPFSESSTYAVDDIRLYGTGLYKCHTAVVTPGPWTGSTNWQVYKLSEGGSGGGGASNQPIDFDSVDGGGRSTQSIADNAFTCSFNDTYPDWSINVLALTDSVNLTDVDKIKLSCISNTFSGEALVRLYITTVNTYTRGSNIWSTLLSDGNISAQLEITEDGDYEVDTSEIVGVRYIYVVVLTGLNQGQQGICDDSKLGAFDGTFILSKIGAANDYPDLSNKPRINNVELLGNKTSAQLGLMASDGVVANPSDEATDVLQKIKIGNTVYSIPGSGGNEALLVPRGPYVDTGILGSTSGLKIQISLRVMDVEEQAIFGANWSLTGFFLMTYRGAFRFHSGNVSVDSSQISKGELYNIEATKTGVTVNGTTYALSNPSGNDDNANILLFTTPNSQGSGTSGIVYSCKMYNGDTLLRDFSPATDNNNVACLYDAVSDTYFYNLGTDEFFVM